MIEAILTDIEGTTSSISFVHDVLFPYARARMESFVREHAEEPQVAQQLEAVRALSGYPGDLDGDIQQLLAWIDQDKKVTPLKALQGMIWEQGYRDGDFHGHVYDDAVENLRRWHDQGVALYVYSSGSVHAQKLLFGHTSHGDLTPLFSGYFDTRIGAKGEPVSYENILAETQVPAVRMLFLSDVVAELDAARAAGINTACLQRETVLRDVGHPVFADFNGIDLAVMGG